MYNQSAEANLSSEGELFTSEGELLTSEGTTNFQLDDLSRPLYIKNFLLNQDLANYLLLVILQIYFVRTDYL